MKRILYIGKRDNIINNLKPYLSQHFQLRLCSERLEVIKGMMKIANPDLILVGMSDFEEPLSDLFEFFAQEYAMTPIILMGVLGEEALSCMEFYGSDQFDNIEDASDHMTVLRACYEKLGMDFDAVAEALQQEENEEEEDNSKKRILLVDDSSILLRNMKAMLQDIYNIEVATSGIQALAVLENKHTDLILLDYEMPIVNGKMTFELIRQKEKFRNIPVIFLTGVADKDHVEEVLRLKPDGYFLKPPVREKLLAAIDEVLHKRDIY